MLKKQSQYIRHYTSFQMSITKAKGSKVYLKNKCLRKQMTHLSEGIMRCVFICKKKKMEFVHISDITLRYFKYS